jgi:hypothetical protein
MQDPNITRFTQLEMASTTNPKGAIPTLRVPVLKTAEFSEIINPKQGMIAYDSDLNSFQYYGEDGWKPYGNAPTVPFVPTLTTEQIGDLVDPQPGSLVYDTEEHKLKLRTEAAWETVTSEAP